MQELKQASTVSKVYYGGKYGYHAGGSPQKCNKSHWHPKLCQKVAKKSHRSHMTLRDLMKKSRTNSSHFLLINREVMPISRAVAHTT